MNLQDTKNKLTKLGIGLRPILFSTPMVHAIIERSKTQTRRALKVQPPKSVFRYDGIDTEDASKHWFEDVKPEGRTIEVYHGPVKCPCGKPGDILWVRETWCFNGVHYLHKADHEVMPFRWKPSIHMPFEAARLFLRIKSVRIDRLDDISEQDAISEGILFHKPVPGDGDTIYKDYMSARNGFSFPEGSFWSLWESINGPESFNANPWVWVVKFEKINLTEFIQ